MKLVILSLAYNEDDKIANTLSKIPRNIPRIDKVEILVVNDGSTDQTIEMALNAGADKIVSHKTNMGVGAAFMTGIRNAISMNADIVVTIDADGENDPREISDLINPILDNQFDVMIGTRFSKNVPKNYPKIRYYGNKIYARLISTLVGHKFTDTQTGFRAYSKEAISSITVVNHFTYTQEVLFDLYFKKFRIGETPVYDFYRLDESKVVKSIPKYVVRSMGIIFGLLIYNRPVLSFGLFGLLLSGIGIVSKLITFYVPHILTINTTLTSGLILLGAVSFMMGLFANLVFKRQSFTEKDLRYRLRLFDNENSSKF